MERILIDRNDVLYGKIKYLYDEKFNIIWKDKKSRFKNCKSNNFLKIGKLVTYESNNIWFYVYNKDYSIMFYNVKMYKIRKIINNIETCIKRNKELNYECFTVFLNNYLN